MLQIFEYNGSALVAMVGKNCFAIASDRRLGVQLQTIATDFQRISKIHDRLFLGLSGLATDAQTLYAFFPFFFCCPFSFLYYMFCPNIWVFLFKFFFEGIKGLSLGISFIS